MDISFFIATKIVHYFQFSKYSANFLAPLQCLLDARSRPQVGVCGEVAAELQGADGEDTRRHRQGGGKGAEDVMLKRRGKGEEGAF